MTGDALAAGFLRLLSVIQHLAENPIALHVQDYIGGVGNAVAAALQTKGLIDQAKILGDPEFKQILEWIAALAWLVSIATGIGAVAVFGGYRQGAYLLIGPPLFYYMITTTTERIRVKCVVAELPWLLWTTANQSGRRNS